MSIKPTLSVPVFDGEVTMHAFGREHGCNFSFKGFDDSEEVHTTHAPIFQALASISSGEVEAFAAPSPAKMNAKLVTPEELTLATGSAQFTDPGERFFIYRGVDADGVKNLCPAHGYAMSADDCALVVAKAGNKIVSAHAGRDSLVDMNHFKGGPQRPHGSVVDTIFLEAFEEHDAEDLQVWIGFSISPGPHFAHFMLDPDHPHNDRFVRHVYNVYGKECFRDDGQGCIQGWLDTKELIRRQFLHYGVPEKNITLDSMCTYNDQENGEYIWYSHKRQLVTGEAQGRNLIAVVVNR